jgi:hypothetical protein
VKYVVVPDDRLDYTSARERPLVTKWLTATKSGDVTIYEVPDPRPIVPGAEVVRLRHDSITLRVPRQGRYPVAIRKGRGGRVLDAPHRGTFTLRFP